MLCGLSVCLLITTVNLVFFSTAFWTPINQETEEREDKWGNIATPAWTISTGYYEYDWQTLANNKTVAFAILGYGAVTSFVFIFLAMIKSLGNQFLIEIHIFSLIYSGMYYCNSSQEITGKKRVLALNNDIIFKKNI